MSIPGYEAYLAEALTPRLYKDSEGEVTIRVVDLDGLAADISIFDTIDLSMKNYPEKDTEITFSCTADDDDGLCYFAFTITQSAAWLAAPYDSQLSFKIFDRDENIVDSDTGFVPVTRDLYVSGVTQSFVVGEEVEGGSSGETAIVYEVGATAGNIQLLTLCVISGEFSDGESLTGDQGGSGSVYGTLDVAVPLYSKFGDSVGDLSSVRANDELTVDGVTYIVEGFDSLVSGWITLTIPLHLSGSGLSYEIDSYDPATSGVSRLFKSEIFPMQVRESL
jgi:hypothetical protein